MGSSIPSFYPSSVLSMKRNHRPLQLRAQGRKDEGRSSDSVVANLGVLRERIEQVKLKERLEKCYTRKNGWHYTRDYNHESNRSTKSSQSLELLGLASWIFSLTIGSGILGLLLVSFLLHIKL